jgi:LysR family transcriptional regulator, glycine cleavage system transcriptional activator
LQALDVDKKATNRAVFKMDRLPPLNPLRAFEATGRLRSIRRAADELCVTAGAVSRQIQALEAYLGVKLFRRESRAVALTANGEQYLAAVHEHIEGIRRATLNLTGGQGKDTLKIRAYTTFAMRWLIPRLSQFQAANPTVEVRLTTSLEAVDFRAEDVDCAVRLGDGKWPGARADRLIPNELLPVCSPGYRQILALNDAVDLQRATFLHSLARPDDWLLWLEAAGLPTEHSQAGPKYESSVLTYQAALDGQGVAIAQRAFVAEDIEAGRLVQPFGPILDRGEFTYYLIYPEDRLRKFAFRRFRIWLQDACKSNP